ncbi:MAG TPA: cytochrome c [Vicinamibacterales bacterium]|jgi:mono/diheme cytochrome c family protein|nr:cytochrome c [Vicinamibacterales bacterium]
MKHSAILASVILSTSALVAAHDMGSMVTWNREISRLVYDRCASCHRPGGAAFSLVTYSEAQQNVVAIKEAVLSRRMPPWGAVKGFGSFRNDQALTQEQIELVVTWVESGARRGNNPLALPKPPQTRSEPVFVPSPRSVAVSGDVVLDRALLLDGVFPERVPEASSMRIVARRPDGSEEPIVWLHGYAAVTPHPFLFRKPLSLPAGTALLGVLPSARVLLIPAETR